MHLKLRCIQQAQAVAMTTRCILLTLILLSVTRFAQACSNGYELHCVPLSHKELFSTSENGTATGNSVQTSGCLEHQLFTTELNISKQECPDSHILCCIVPATDHNSGSDSQYTWTLPWASILILIPISSFTLIMITLMARQYVHRRNPTKRQEEAIQYCEEVRIEGRPQCVICLAEVDCWGSRLQCGHCFHKDCILTWWAHTPRNTFRCPTCKQLPTPRDHAKIPYTAVLHAAVCGNTALC